MNTTATQQFSVELNLDPSAIAEVAPRGIATTILKHEVRSALILLRERMMDWGEAELDAVYPEPDIPMYPAEAHSS